MLTGDAEWGEFCFASARITFGGKMPHLMTCLLFWIERQTCRLQQISEVGNAVKMKIPCDFACLFGGGSKGIELRAFYY